MRQIPLSPAPGARFSIYLARWLTSSRHSPTECQHPCAAESTSAQREFARDHAIAQDEALDLAGAGERPGVDLPPVGGGFRAGEMLAAMGDECAFVERSAGV